MPLASRAIRLTRSGSHAIRGYAEARSDLPRHARLCDLLGRLLPAPQRLVPALRLRHRRDARRRDGTAPAYGMTRQQWCANRYRSYRITDNTYQPLSGGPRRTCVPR